MSINEQTSVVHKSLAALLREILEGPAPEPAWVLNPGDDGLLRSLDKLSAAGAAVPAAPPAPQSARAGRTHRRWRDTARASSACPPLADCHNDGCARRHVARARGVPTDAAARPASAGASSAPPIRPTALLRTRRHTALPQQPINPTGDDRHDIGHVVSRETAGRVKAQRLAVLREHAIDHQRVDVHVQVQRTAERTYAATTARQRVVILGEQVP
jgi:hypothetical protein